MSTSLRSLEHRASLRWMPLVLRWFMVLAILGCAHTTPKPEKPAVVNVMLSNAPSAEPGKVHLTFQVQSDVEHRLCIWHTPLEGIASNILDVHDSSGNLVDFQGMMLKRGQPRESDYVTLQPGQPLSATFEVTDEYAVTAGETYTVKFIGSPSINGLPDSNVVEIVVP